MMPSTIVATVVIVVSIIWLVGSAFRFHTAQTEYDELMAKYNALKIQYDGLATKYDALLQEKDEAYIFEPGEVEKGIDLGGYLDCCQMTEVDPLTVGIATHEELKHFLEFEINITTERLGDKSNPCFNGVVVGTKEAHRLKELHIKFCQHMLAMLNK